jgi:hypothetical protein
MLLADNTLEMIILGRMVWRSPSHRSVRLQFSLNATYTMMSCAPPIVTPPPVLNPDWERLLPPDLDACLTSSFVHQFYGATDKPSSTLFWGPPRNRRCDFEAQIIKPELLVLSTKPENPKPPILRSNREKPSPQVLRPNRRKPSILVLGLNQETHAPYRPWFWGWTKKLTLLVFFVTSLFQSLFDLGESLKMWRTYQFSTKICQNNLTDLKYITKFIIIF